MRNRLKTAFLQRKRSRSPLFGDDTLQLIPREYHNLSYGLGDCNVYVFDICSPKGWIMGEIALRIGEGDGLYYLGHIGYHIDPPYQGHHYSATACRLVLPMFRDEGFHSLVITTDPDNLPSQKICLRVGCIPEALVKVPQWARKAYSMGEEKQRFILCF